jgi:hypothetical protein
MSGPNPEGAAPASPSADSPKAPTGPARKPVSPVRNAIGLVVLIAVVVIGSVEITSKYRFNAAVNALNERSSDETKELMTQSETNVLLGRQPNGPGVDVGEMGSVFTRKIYTWPSLSGHRFLTAYFTKQSEPRLHHYETPGATSEAAGKSTPAVAPPQAGGLPSKAFAPPSGPGGGGSPKGKGARPAMKKAPETKAEPAPPDASPAAKKAPETKAEPAPPDASPAAKKAPETKAEPAPPDASPAPK